MSIKDEFLRRNAIYGTENGNADRTKQLLEEERRRRAENAYRDRIVEENREKREEAEQMRSERLFYEVARMDFFAANPTASEDEFKRLIPQLRAEYLLENFRHKRAQAQREAESFYPPDEFK